MKATIALPAATLEFEERGQGQPVLFLDAGEGVAPNRDWLDLLAATFPCHSANTSGLGFRSLAGLDERRRRPCLSLFGSCCIARLADAILAGAGFGGWIAAEMAVRNTQRFVRLVLAAPLGIKLGGVLDRDITDMHAIGQDRLMELAWADPRRGSVDFTCQPEERSRHRARPGIAAGVRLETVHAQPTTETLASSDRLSDAAGLGRAGSHRTSVYSEGWRAALPDARLEIIEDAGHFPHWEQPARFAEHVLAFADRG